MIVVLSLICASSGALLVNLKQSTKDKIDQQVLTYVQGPALLSVLADRDNDPIADRVKIDDVTIFPAIQHGRLVSVALETSAPGYSGDVSVMVGFDIGQDNLIGIGITTQTETPGLGTRITLPAFTGQFKGHGLSAMNLTSKDGDIAAISGATYSSTGTVEAVRKAISLAYNVDNIRVHYNNQMIPAEGPIPPGVAGNDSKFKNPYSRYNLELAREYMRKAGYPGGIDPAAGEPLSLTYDQNGNSSAYRQLAELMIKDMAKIGIKIVPQLNNKPRFFQKLRKGKFQLFRLSWIGDYPDAENFLQLFYSKNAGSCNRAFFRDAEFDRMFEEIIPMPDSPERTRKYKKMVKYLSSKCPWIFESFAVSYQLNHDWLQNFIPHDFAFSRWKYLNIDAVKRSRMKKNFKPLSFKELRGK